MTFKAVSLNGWPPTVPGRDARGPGGGGFGAQHTDLSPRSYPFPALFEGARAREVGVLFSWMSNYGVRSSEMPIPATQPPRMSQSDPAAARGTEYAHARFSQRTWTTRETFDMKAERWPQAQRLWISPGK